MVEFVCATRKSKEEFWKSTPLGISLMRISGGAKATGSIFYENEKGLSEVYNICLNNPYSSEILVFIHDDVWLDDLWVVEKIKDALSVYDIVGVAGNERLVEGDYGWAFLNDRFELDEEEHLSGRVAHRDNTISVISYYGKSPKECALLDGVFIAVNKIKCNEKKVVFDPQFKFHFYDLDFCRTAKEKSLKLGTWPISLTHQSGGEFNSEAWRKALCLYRLKWGVSLK